MNRPAIWMAIAFVAIPALHIRVAPYTKVEESFTLHAVHDVLRYGLWPSNHHLWDHRTFPGAVPRSFLPPIILGLLTWPVAALATFVGSAKDALKIQVLVRLIVAYIFAACFSHLGRTLQRRYGVATAVFFTIFSLAQFHIPYYASRTLPNFLALPPVAYAVSQLLRGKYWAGIVILTAVATVIRLEVALLVLPTALVLVLTGRMSLGSALGAGIAGGIGSLANAAPMDVLLWAPTLPHPSLPDFTPLSTAWPELSAVVFNVVDGHASEWGVMPPTFYGPALVKILLGAFPLVMLAVVWALYQRLNSIETGVFANKTLVRTVGDVSSLLLPGVAVMVGALSLVGHKEWRFIVYTIPILNILAASAAAALWYLPSKGLRVLARLGVIGLIALTAAFTVFSTYVSTANYPGGHVWEELEKIDIPEGATIHFPSYPLQTGATLFTFLHADMKPAAAFPASRMPTWTYSKDEDPRLLSPEGAWDAGIDYVVTPLGDEWRLARREGETRSMWHPVGFVDGLDGVQLGGKYGVEIRTSRKLAILQRQ